MNRIFIIAAFTLSSFSLFAQTTVKKPVAQSSPAAVSTGYNIPFTVTPYKNCWVYLGSYYGKNFVLIDSSRVDAQSTGTFKGKTKLTQGIYFLVSPSRTKLFDIFIDGPQHFTLAGDSARSEPTSITGSPENTLFLEYTAYLSDIGPKMQALEVQLKDPNMTKDRSTGIQTQLAAYNKQLNTYRDNMMKAHPNSILAMMFNLIKSPEVPKLPELPNGKLDSSYAGRYMKEHYWDNVAFNDDRILHTPVFDPKLENYFKYYVSPAPDSIIAEVNYMLLYARTSKEMFRYLLGRFTDKYINPEIMGQDKVFVFLFNNYFTKGDTTWLNAAQKKYIFDRGYSLMLAQIGEVGAPLDLVDTAGKPVSMYNVKAPFTFVVFWDPTCSHCKEQVPEVDSIYEAKWKAEGVKVFAVNVNDATMMDWKAFIKEHHLNDWVHAYQTKEEHDADNKANRVNFRQAYDVYQTPTMYLLDVNKHIIAKHLTIFQFDGLIDATLKQPAINK